MKKRISKLKPYLSLLLSHHKKDECGDRCFKVGRIYLCKRCSSIVMGLIVSMLFFASSEYIIFNNPFISVPLSLIFVFPLGIDGGLDFLEIRSSTSKRRVMTGFMFGFGLVFILLYVPYLVRAVFGVFLTFIALFSIIWKDTVYEIVKRRYENVFGKI